jgi:hypothetical protein
MTELLIDNKKYFVVPQKEYFLLQKKAASKKMDEPVLSLEEAREYSKKMIRTWAKEK